MKYAKLEVKLRVGKKYILDNIKVRDPEFLELLSRATNSYVPLNDLLLNFWYYKSQIPLKVRDFMFDKVFLRFKTQETQTSFPQNVDVKISSKTKTVALTAEFVSYVLRSVPYDDRMKLLEYFAFFDGDTQEDMQCIKMPIKKFKEFLEIYARLYPDELFRIEEKGFAATLDVKYIK